MSLLRIAVCDYGVGNVRSVERALLRVGAEVRITGAAGDLEAADGIVLPGVGAFGPAVDALRRRGLEAVLLRLAAQGMPLLGVCLGHQLLFESSEESGGRAGLGLLRGRVVRLSSERGRVPHMGWNRVHVVAASPLLEGVAEGMWAYFAHSYHVLAADDVVVATTDYHGPVVAACARGNLATTQFHPEKSGVEGLRIYANFVHSYAAAGAGR